MALDRDGHKAFKELLLGLPGWNRGGSRKSFLNDVFWGHSLLTRLRFEVSGDEAADVLLEELARLESPDVDGLTPACALLSEIRDRGWAGGTRANTLRRLQQALRCAPVKPEWPHDPYPGLLAFDRPQAPIFFGRTAETRDLLRRLETEQGQRFLLVTGSSGSGKSSLVRAGVWAQLEKGGVPNLPTSTDWLITAMFPSSQGGDPFLALATSLAGDRRFGLLRAGGEAEMLKKDPAAFDDLLTRVLSALTPGAEWLLILDQMEELFTPAAEALREPFLDFVLSAVERPGFRVMATIRSDFLNRCVDHVGLREVINRGGQYSVGRPGAVAMARMITGPVEEVDLGRIVEVEDALVERMVADAVSEPGGLALLAFTLKELYRQCTASGRMGLEVYCDPDFDGLKGVIGRHADAALARADERAKAALPKVFSRLVTVQTDGTATRRRERLDYWRDNADAQRLIAHLSDAASDRAPGEKNRLLVTGAGDRPTVEVAHEALLREWATLTTWIEERREALRLREQLKLEARAWAAGGHPDGLRWRYERLAPARDLLLDADLLDELERDPVCADFVTPNADWLLAEILCSSTDHIRREDIGLRLAEIGDPRPGVGVINGVPNILWCEILGIPEIPKASVEIEGHGCFPVSTFHMAAYPVTEAQFEAFLKADDFRADEWWDGLKSYPPVIGSIRRHDNHPARFVSWYEATAYCRWLSDKLGYAVRLPDEWEWQWAAQSAAPDHLYPWGAEWRDGVANTKEAGIGRTTAVGMYPNGQSEQGVHDLAGNIWEWCRNRHDEPRVTKAGAEGPRVLRGGSWDIIQTGARANVRVIMNHPDGQDRDIGFRVVCGSPIH